jgi:hypothetical protein
MINDNQHLYCPTEQLSKSLVSLHIEPQTQQDVQEFFVQMIGTLLETMNPPILQEQMRQTLLPHAV